MRFRRRKRKDADTQAAWKTYDATQAERLAWATYETYPSGSGDTTLATLMQDTGMLYAANLALHGAGLAFAVNHTPADKHEEAAAIKARDKGGPLTRGTGPIDGLTLLSTLDPEGVTFDELGHRESLDKMSDAQLGILCVRFGEAHARFVSEAKRRARRA